MLAHEVVRQVVHQACLLLASRALAAYVVEEDGKGADAKPVHEVQLVHYGKAGGPVPLDVAARVDGPNELHVVAMSSLYEFPQPCSLCLGIGFAPMCPMVGVVLRPIDVDVQSAFSVELELPQAVLMAPGIAVEALNDASAGDTRPVAYLEGGTPNSLKGKDFLILFPEATKQVISLQRRACDGLQRLPAIERAAFVSACHNDLCRRDLQVVTLCLRRNLLPISLHSLVAKRSDNNGGPFSVPPRRESLLSMHTNDTEEKERRNQE